MIASKARSAAARANGAESLGPATGAGSTRSVKPPADPQNRKLPNPPPSNPNRPNAAPPHGRRFLDFLGVAYAQRGDRVRAEQEFRNALTLHPDLADARQNLTRLLAMPR